MNGADKAIVPEWLPPEFERVAGRLNALGLQDRDSLWLRLTRDNWTSESLLADLNRNLPAEEAITRAELGTVLAELVRLDVDQLSSSPWLARARVAFVALVIAVMHPSGPFTPKPIPPQLVAARDLPPYHILLDDDIAVRPPTTEAKLVAAQRKALIGRYTAKHISSGSPIGADAHADGVRVPGLSDRRVATLRVIPPDAAMSSALPARATLTGAAATVPSVCDDAWILSVGRDGTAATALATVALPESCTAEPLNALLAARAIVLVWAPRP